MSVDRGRAERIKDRTRQAKRREKMKASRQPDTHAVNAAITEGCMVAALKNKQAGERLSDISISLKQITDFAVLHLSRHGYDQKLSTLSTIQRLARIRDDFRDTNRIPENRDDI